MKYQLINKINPNYSPIEQVLTNRGIDIGKIGHYLETTDDDITDPASFGEELMRAAVKTLVQAIAAEDDVVVIVDCDCDGYTSAAILINYLYDCFPAWTQNHLQWYLHSGKQHGLRDCTDWIIKHNFKLVIAPDSASNDFQQHEDIVNSGGRVIVLDHHDVTIPLNYPNAIVINNNALYEDTEKNESHFIHPNRALSGAAVTWQFCRYLDKCLKKDYANNYLDLVAIGNQGDMMDCREIETKHLIMKGLKRENIKNPFITALVDKNVFKLGDGDITPIDASFYIVPFINAMVRSGTLEEKKVLFESMIKYRAFERIESTKRGHQFGETETLVTQAARLVTNVKNRQGKIVDGSIEKLEQIIKEKHLLESHKVLILLLPHDTDIPAEVRGLIANKFMAKYQRPVCILTQTPDGSSYQGSARGCDMVGITDFKQDCLDSKLVDYAQGHPGAFGLGIPVDNVTKLLETLDEKFKDISSEPIYYVDYIFDGEDVKSDVVLQIASLKSVFSTNVNEALVAVKGLKVTNDMITVYRKKTNTLKISLSNGMTIIKFCVTEDEIDRLTPDEMGYIELDIIGTCQINNFNGYTTPQLFIEDLEITDSSAYYF